jgi:uncharacterized delta-60 repeat protein
MNQPHVFAPSILESLEPRRLLAAGDIDRSFGRNGVIVLDDEHPATDLVVQPDGKFLVSNTTGIRRFNSNGTLDNTFAGGDGFLPRPGHSSGMDLHPSGKIYVIGPDTNTWSLQRYNANGTLDTSFGNNGSVATRIGDAHEEIPAFLKIAPSGKIVLAGYQDNDNDDPDDRSPRQDIAVAVFNPDGTVDRSFGGNGEATAFFNILQDLAVAPNGNIIVVGQYVGESSHSMPADFFEFGSTGSMVDQAPSLTGFSENLAAAYTTDGTRVIASNSTGNSALEFGRASDRTVVPLFFNPLDPFRILDSVVNDLFTTPDNKTLVAGFAGAPLYSGAGAGLVRFNPDGTPDNTFGFGGLVARNFNRRKIEWLDQVALLPDGDIIAAGYIGSTGGRHEPGQGGKVFLTRFDGGARTVGQRRPVAALVNTSIGTFNNQISFDVVYAAEDLIDQDTIGDRDVRIFGPNGYAQFARVTDVQPRYGGRQIQVSYSVPAPGGQWDASDNGRYSIVLRRRAVRDNFGNAAAARRLARQTFTFDPPAASTRSIQPQPPASESPFSTTRVRKLESLFC